MLPLSGFLRRVGRLAGARRALVAGCPEDALAVLGDPALCLSPTARRLRGEALEVLCRQAVQRSAAGRDRSALRLLGVLAGESPERAEECRTRLRWLASAAGPPGPARGSAGGEPGSGRGRERASGAPPAAPPRPASTREEEPGAAGTSGPALFELAVDDGGQHLVAVAAELVLGHLRGGVADLGFLADVGAEHARLTRRESLRAGPGWSVAPVGGERVLVNGEPVAAAGRRLLDGDLVELAVNLVFRFREPDPASGTVLLELLRGAECAGCGSIVLMSAGAGGRLRIGTARNRHVRVARLKGDVVIEAAEGELSLSCAAGLREVGGEPVESARVPCPPDRRRAFEVGAASAAGPPLALALAPVEGAGARRRT